MFPFARAWRLFLGLLFISPAALARAEFDEIRDLVSGSYRAQASDENPQIAEINARALQVDRPLTSGEDLVRIKFLLSQWRLSTRDYLLRDASRSAEKYARSVSELNQLGAILGELEIARLLSLHLRFSDAVSQADFEALLVSHGDPQYVREVLDPHSPNRRLLTPSTAVRLGPINPHPWWRSQGWLSVRDADAYVWDRDCVMVRGVRVCSGDVLLVDLAKIFDGINTSFSEPRSSFTHNGMVTFLEVDGRKVPAVFEIHSVGMRVVPLARYLTPDFIYYGEIYRLRAGVRRPANYDARLSELVLRILKDQIGYDFNARPIPMGGYDAMVECGQVGAVCSTSIDMLNRSLETDVELKPSGLAPQARRNIGATGLEILAERGTYLTPTDFKFSADYEQVGTIDNNFSANLVREWMMGAPTVPGSFGYRMNTQTLDVSSLPFWKGGAFYRFVKALAKVAHAPWPISSPFFALANSLVGLSRKTLPQAPGETLAAVVALNNRLEAAGKKLLDCPEVLLAASQREAFDLFHSEGSDEVRGRVDGAFTDVALDRAFK